MKKRMLPRECDIWHRGNRLPHRSGPLTKRLSTSHRCFFHVDFDVPPFANSFEIALIDCVSGSPACSPDLQE